MLIKCYLNEECVRSAAPARDVTAAMRGADARASAPCSYQQANRFYDSTPLIKL